MTWQLWHTTKVLRRFAIIAASQGSFLQIFEFVYMVNLKAGLSVVPHNSHLHAFNRFSIVFTESLCCWVADVTMSVGFFTVLQSA